VDSQDVPVRLYKIYKTLHFYFIKLPFIFIMIPIGFIFEYLITFPFLILTTLDRNAPKKTRDKKQPH